MFAIMEAEYLGWKLGGRGLSEAEGEGGDGEEEWEKMNVSTPRPCFELSEMHVLS